MDLKEIKDLMTAMRKTGIQKLIIKKKEGDELQLETQVSSNISSVGFPSTEQNKEQTFFHSPPIHSSENHSPLVKEEKPGQHITAPLVGTIYHSASPDDEPFVKVGDMVKEDTVLCIIEAMKVMNEVKAGRSGKIAEILVENGHPVEFGTKMFRIV
ncbi:Biotin carboxyl carrier protein of acetyl-CoA carboxylase [Candidatus Rhabdochlamydia oedothoracis]|uniref:Biotin carboxyl carrier protein of acetyl-CoA carboxylase n=1 Tax=Candidatus Rhabdochlamydia oedothoracis TaxID=2720720 RepID=A0ABX8V1F6_9BACT|nr:MULTISPECIES: acetyl-CoA carboxylase biotin carboxyl carrier protein [Rhabdochlamydia]KAG6559470.1 Biotin carboxyl carrier protein of acetyl-CoA carboxylase [Candidatus Rhabdochlamydia sp. W815]MCL6756162.1 acetyl-CoA carboxylase biotin carboxyl carrier protein [Candidatus Rhabdochlamydia oedothoracis]QYF49053.1 Biotin carboxyl carrier protein of acetyl-CoA carboxylase [Candidatus Rhabdochlamydia oedothoracis]